MAKPKTPTQSLRAIRSLLTRYGDNARTSLDNRKLGKAIFQWEKDVTRIEAAEQSFGKANTFYILAWIVTALVLLGKNPVLGRRIVLPDEQDAAGQTARETADLTDWVLDNIQLPKDVRQQFERTRRRLRSRS